MRFLFLLVSFLLIADTPLLGNGGAWQTGVPETGNGAASDQKKSTNVTIEDEKLTIDLHQEFAAVEVRYRMRNTGEQVEQGFFFPMEHSGGPNRYHGTTWAEGVDGDGIGENITLKVLRPLPLDSILIVPGYLSEENPTLWSKNNRVAELEVTLNSEKSFTVAIPDKKFTERYPIPVRDYAKPVSAIKLTIKGVHRGTAARDTCISAVVLRGKLAKKPEFSSAR